LARISLFNASKFALTSLALAVVAGWNVTSSAALAAALSPASEIDITDATIIEGIVFENEIDFFMS
jgi:hypothetical protein